MSIFEFILVMASLIIAIGITVLLRHLAAIVINRQTIEISGIAIGWMVFHFLSATAMWWTFWDYIGVEWTFPLYMYVLLCPTLQFLAISMLVSTDITKPDASLLSTFEQIRFPYMVLMALFQVTIAWDGWVLGVEPFWNELRSVQAVAVSIYVVGALTTKLAIHRILVTAILGMQLGGTFLLRYLPGAYGSV